VKSAEVEEGGKRQSKRGGGERDEEVEVREGEDVAR
jgi:hypothetical protein